MKLFLGLLVLLVMMGCSPKRPATVDEISQQNQRNYTQSKARKNMQDQKRKTHRVVRGDSLYSIGFRYQVDYKTLAAINDIKAPYRIYPNQIIELQGQPKKVYFKPQNNNQSSSVQVKPLVTNPTINAQEDTPKPGSKTTKAAVNTSSKPVVKQPQSTQSVVQNKPTTKRPTARKPTPVPTPNNTNLKWLWPTQGKIRTTFLASNPARKGISIGGKEGQAVKATEAGVVVYSGNGLLGYGELVIIKHNDSYLSAYGHNKRLKVKEGQSVTRGQVIAELGSSGTNVDNLHFEIRKNGTPVNPLNYVKP